MPECVHSASPSAVYVSWRFRPGRGVSKVEARGAADDGLLLNDTVRAVIEVGRDMEEWTAAMSPKNHDVTSMPRTSPGLEELTQARDAWVWGFR